MADKTPYLVERLKHYRTKAAECGDVLPSEDYKAWFSKTLWEVRAETMEHVLDVLGVEYD
ncbi:MAG: hypothetical protein IBX50_13985 [Marinospirillum sp.]|uniref:hypothetical protein n=1 Tax=Marinospirillum sp. TaxID=2183934 RepID=UPI001A09DC95|nr:hypothetical protein [Marinospirillum sp.]MBE0507797.1 hypothetical protein [Marinospirillum sp.]